METQNPFEQLQSSETLAAQLSARRIYYGYVIVVVCFLVMMLLAPMLASFSIFYVAILDDLHWSRADTALALSVFFLVSGTASPFAGKLIDRFGPRIAMPLGAVITASAFVWISQMRSLSHFYLAFGVLGAIGSTMLNIVPMTTLVSNWFVRQRGLAIGLVTAGQGLGQVGIPVIQYLIDHIGWRGAYLVLGAIVFVVPTALILIFLYSKPEDRHFSINDEPDELWRWKRGSSSGEQTAQEPDSSSREVVVLDRQWAETEWTISKAIRTFRFWALTAGMALLSIGFVMISVQLVAYLKDKGYSSTLAASAVGFEGLVNVGGRFLGGGLSDRVGREKTVLLGIGLLCICLLLLIASGIYQHSWLVYSFSLCYGVGFGMTLPALMASVADLFQGKHFGTILGVCWMCGYAGGAFGAWLSGYLFDMTHAYHVNFIIIGAVMVSSAILFWKASPSQVRVVRQVQVG